MTTFNTKNQAKRKYFYIAGILVILLVVVTLAFNSFRKSNKCDPNSDITNLSLTESNNEVKNEIRDYVTISTDYGKIRGLKNKFNNNTINTFLGVPYASPPIGFLRFERTSSLQKWDGVRDALQQPASCLQVILFFLSSLLYSLILTFNLQLSIYIISLLNINELQEFVCELNLIIQN